MKLFLALALMSVCPPDWHRENVDNYRWLERSWQEDNERVADERDKDSIVCHVARMNQWWELTRIDDAKTHLKTIHQYYSTTTDFCTNNSS